VSEKANIDSVGIAVELGSPIGAVGSPIPQDELEGFVEIPKLDTRAGQIESIVETFQSPMKNIQQDVKTSYENAILIGHTSIFVDWFMRQKA